MTQTPHVGGSNVKTAAPPVTVFLSVILAACGGQPVAQSPSPGGDTATATAAATDSEATQTQGDDRMTTYEGETFSVSYERPPGWTDQESADGVLIEPPAREGGVYISAIAAAVDPQDPEGRAVVDVELTSEALADWLHEHPHLDATEPEDATLGGLSGRTLDVALDVTVAAEPDEAPAECADVACTVLFWAEEPNEEQHPDLIILYEEGPGPYAQNPTWILEDASGTLIFVTAFVFDPDDLASFLDEAQPVLDSLAFE